MSNPGMDARLAGPFIGGARASSTSPTCSGARLAGALEGFEPYSSSRATHVPHQTDKRGTERTTTVNSTSLMSWPPPLQQHERIPGICLISMKS
jgi:hypothetical protein